jgi:2,3-dihydroxybenzoate decarboxylase
VLAGANSALELLPSEYFRRNFVITTSGMTTAPPLRLALDALGVERIQFSGDYPYENVRAGVDFIEPPA